MWQCCGAVEAGETVSLVWAEPGAASVSPAFSPCVCSKPFKSGLLPVFEGVLVRFLCFFSLYLFVFFFLLLPPAGCQDECFRFCQLIFETFLILKLFPRHKNSFITGEVL